jgi:transposase-like protein
MVEVQGKGSFTNVAPAGSNAFIEEWQTNQTHYPPKEPQSLSCPECGNKKVWRDGHRTPMFGDPIQRWSCPKCFYKFSDPVDVENARKACQQAQTIESMKLKSDAGISSTRQICVENNKETKNLVADQITTLVVPQKRELDPEKRQKIKGAIVDFVWHLQKNAYSEDTYLPYSENLQHLVKMALTCSTPKTSKKW